MLQNVKLVVHDPALRHPLLQALLKGFPHIDASGSNRTPLKSTQSLLEKLVQRFFLPLPSEPQRLSRLQVRNYRQKLLLLPEIDFVHSHLPSRWPSPTLGPAFQIPQVDGPHRAGSQAQLPRHSSYRRALASQPHRFLKALTEGRLARQLRYFLHLDPALRTAHSIQLDHHRRAVLEAGQIPHLALVNLGHLPHRLSTSRTHQLAVAALASHP